MWVRGVGYGWETLLLIATGQMTAVDESILIKLEFCDIE